MDCIGCVGGVFAPLRWVVCHGDCQCVGAEVVAVGFLVDGFEKSLNFNFLPKEQSHNLVETSICKNRPVL